MAAIRLSQVLEGLAGHPVGLGAEEEVVFGGVVIDSRLAAPGNLFVALRGERVDGHAFVGDA